MSSDIQRRVAAVEATAARFIGKPHAYGSVDCVRIGAWHLRNLGRKVSGLGKAGAYKTPLGARRALQRAGFATLADALVANGLIEIPPAAALPADLVLSDGTDGLESLGIYAGSRNVLGFAEGFMAEGLKFLRLADFGAVRAWRV